MKRLIPFLFGIFLAVLMIAPYAHAETIPAEGVSEGWRAGLGTYACSISSTNPIRYTDWEDSKNAAYGEWVGLWPVGSPSAGGCGNTPPSNCDGSSRTLVSSSVTGTTISYTYDTGSHSTCTNVNGSSTIQYRAATYECPPIGGWTLSGNSCTRPNCTSPEVRNEDTGACEIPPSGACIDRKNQTASSGFYDMGTNPNNPFPAYQCDGTCAAVFDGVAPATTTIVNGVRHYYAKGELTWNGDECTNPNMVSSTSVAPQNSCGTGQTGGYVNGKFTCVDNVTSKPVPTDAPKTDSKTTTESVTNPDDSVTTTTTTTYPDGTSKTIVTTNPAPGSTDPVTTEQTTNGGLSDGKETPIEDYCVTNPDSPICSKSEASGGENCEAPPVCSGDPIQCQILRQQWENRCAQVTSNKRVEEGGDWGNDQIDEAGSLVNPLDNPTEINILSSWDDTDLLGAHSCPAPKQMVTPLGTYSLPFDTFCDLAAMIGNLILIFASFLSFRMVIGAL
jgi:hypothetical protein